MRTKIIIAMAVIASLIVIFMLIRACTSKAPPILNEPKLSSEITSYANNHMDKKQLDIPPEVSEWKVKEVLIHEIETMPGVKGDKLVTTTVIVSYKIPKPSGNGEWQEFERKNAQFRIERRYPEGINVQVYRL